MLGHRPQPLCASVSSSVAGLPNTAMHTPRTLPSCWISTGTLVRGDGKAGEGMPSPPAGSRPQAETSPGRHGAAPRLPCAVSLPGGDCLTARTPWAACPRPLPVLPDAPPQGAAQAFVPGGFWETPKTNRAHVLVSAEGWFKYALSAYTCLKSTATQSASVPIHQPVTRPKEDR